MRPIAPAFCILAVAGMALGIEAGLAVAATKVKRYQAWTPEGDPVVGEFIERRGDCNSSSSATGRSDAWRCFTGSHILDPCATGPS
jgi:hypothetical protein